MREKTLAFRLNLLKAEIRLEIRNGKNLLKLLKESSKSITRSGYVVESSNYERRMGIENHISILKTFLDRLNAVCK